MSQNNNSDRQKKLYDIINARKFDKEAFEALAPTQDDVNALDQSGFPMLHSAIADSFKKEVFDALVEAGADVDAKDKWGQPLLLSAIEPFKKEAFDALVEAGADLTVKDSGGQSLCRRYLNSGDDPEVKKQFLAAAESFPMDIVFDAYTSQEKAVVDICRALDPGKFIKEAAEYMNQGGELVSFPDALKKDREAIQRAYEQKFGKGRERGYDIESHSRDDEEVAKLTTAHKAESSRGADSPDSDAGFYTPTSRSVSPQEEVTSTATLSRDPLPQETVKSTTRSGSPRPHIQLDKDEVNIPSAPDSFKGAAMQKRNVSGRNGGRS